MSQGVSLKHEQIAAQLSESIRSGRVKAGSQLPSEQALARKFRVSRSTVRAALAQLADQGLIATRTGKGSFVLFDGRTLDSPRGWSEALAAQGAEMAVRVVRLELIEDLALAERLGLGAHEFVLVERTRTASSGTTVSYERSRVPAVGLLRDLPRTGLVNGSLNRSLSKAGLRPSRTSQRIGARVIDAGEAAVLERQAGEWFLEVTRTSYDLEGHFVEHVESLLDPVHFSINIEFSEEA
jgi:GntR family transcriptional regulator